MAEVTGTFKVVLDGVETPHTISMSYAQFWRAQRKVLNLLNETSDWGLDQLLGIPPEFVGSPTGDVRYEYQVDFAAGGTSEGSNRWNSMPADAAAYIGDKLNAAFE